MTTTYRKFIKIFTGLAISCILLAAFFLYSGNSRHRDLVFERQQAVVRQVNDMLSRDMHAHASDARFLARLARRYMEHGHVDLRALEDIFADFSRSRTFYFSLAYFDVSGRELLRVERSYAGPVVIPPAMLEDNGGGAVFKKTIEVEQNDVYVSHFELYRKNGRLERPLRPILSFGCPVIDSLGKVVGAVIVTYEGRILLNTIQLNTEAEEGVVLIADYDGNWILGPTQEESWGHLVKDREGLGAGQRFPRAWERIKMADTGQFANGRGLFSFETVSLAIGAILPDKPGTGHRQTGKWKVMTWVPEEQLSVPWMNLYLIIGLVFLGLLAMGSWHLADNMAHQEESESRLRENEERTMAISQSSQDAIAMLDEDGRIIHWNPAAEKLFGYSTSEIMGSALHELLVPESQREKAELGLKEFAETGKGPLIGSILDFRGIHKDGREFPLELAVSTFQFKGKWYAVGTMRDTARRREREREIRRSEETSRALINAATESAMLISFDGTIEAANKVGAQLFGYTVDELLGENAFERGASILTEHGPEMVTRVRLTGEPSTFEDTLEDKRLLITIYPVKGDDETVDRLAIFGRDVTEQRNAEAALKHSEQRFRDVSESIGEVIWETDAEGLLKFITQDVQAFSGVEADAILGKPMSAFLPEEDVDDFNHWRRVVYARQEPFANVEAKTRDKDGNTVWLQINGTPYFDEDGTFLGYRGAAMDITDRKATETAIKANERKLRALAESAYDAIIMIDSGDRVSFWNDAAEQLFGYTEEEVLGESIHPLITPPEDLEATRVGMANFASRGMGPAVGAVTEVIAMRKDGTRFEAERSIASFRLESEWYAVATVRDITERKATEARLLELATTDSLTGLYNRRRFMELCEREFSRSVRYERPLVMFMLDIDHFKRVNDEYGHDAGDRVLRSLSELFILALRGADILGRVGGEEFCVLLPETDADAALEVAERLRQSIERSPVKVNSHSLKITVSIGVSILSPEMHSIDTLIKGADVALYEAKQTGRNKVVVHTPEMDS